MPSSGQSAIEGVSSSESLSTQPWETASSKNSGSARVTTSAGDCPASISDEYRVARSPEVSTTISTGMPNSSSKLSATFWDTASGMEVYQVSWPSSWAASWIASKPCADSVGSSELMQPVAASDRASAAAAVGSAREFLNTSSTSCSE